MFSLQFPAYLLGGIGLVALTFVPLTSHAQGLVRTGKSGPVTASRTGAKPEKILSPTTTPMAATAPEEAAAQSKLTADNVRAAITRADNTRANITRDSIYADPPVAPVFAGGMPALGAYIGANMHYPEAAKQGGITGRVVVQFVLGKDGKVQDAHVISGPGSGLNEEAYRLVWLMPPWEPGRLANGEPVRVNCTLPIMFRAAGQ